jgi:beta-lactam-binding protein with PASTA domain
MGDQRFWKRAAAFGATIAALGVVAPLAGAATAPAPSVPLQSTTAPEMVAVPSVAGLDVRDAYARLHALGLRVTTDHAFDFPMGGRVIAQRIPAGRLAALNVVVGLHTGDWVGPYGASSPAVPDPIPSARVPKLVGHTVEWATAWAAGKDLTWEVRLPALHAGSARTYLANYRVTRQSPRAGKTLALGIGQSWDGGQAGSWQPTPLELHGVPRSSTTTR